MAEWLNTVPAIYFLSALSAAAGGLACFTLACKQNRIRNDRLLRKGGLDVVGGTLVGFFLSLAAASAGASDVWRAVIGFLGGVGWASIVEMVRVKITELAEAAFFGTRRRPVDRDEEG